VSGVGVVVLGGVETGTGMGMLLWGIGRWGRCRNDQRAGVGLVGGMGWMGLMSTISLIGEVPGQDREEQRC